ncbi:sulfotransferase [Sphingobium sufflavum]|uniref:sulfotransferase family protein n=1 Tax=Sphingobium sufflavum TaxID=1129547 RepID=UPI001F368D85|nr:sulfotransferase [Sphingobium sufflavum]MCE7795315.1 sulfotransferase [Sphingobium sufflavum]
MDANAMLAAAREQTGLSDLGDDRILEGLHVLVDSLDREAKLTERGAAGTVARITKMIANRLRVVDYLKQHPDLLERPVARPIFVFGLPRTGTTLVINLLNADPANRGFLRWECFDSVPPVQKGELSSDERYKAEQAMLEMSVKYAPHIAAIHYEDADSPTECQFSMSQSFCAQFFDSVADIPTYHDWFLNKADYRPAFEYHKKLLQVLQENEGGRWVLKNPWHPLFLDDLTAVYPDAQLVMTHRDPVEVVGSACSLVHASRAMTSDAADPHVVADNLLETFDAMIERSEAYRAKHGADSIHDIQYTDLLRDPIAVIRKLYAHFGETLTEEAEAAMRAFLADNQQGKHGKHHYTLEQFGLTKAGVEEHFHDYSERYGLGVKA